MKRISSSENTLMPTAWFLIFCIQWCFDILKNPFWLRKDCSSWDRPVLKQQMIQLGACLWWCKLSRVKPYLATHPSRQYSLPLIITGPGARQLGITPIKTTRLFKVAMLNSSLCPSGRGFPLSPIFCCLTNPSIPPMALVVCCASHFYGNCGKY